MLTEQERITIQNASRRFLYDDWENDLRTLLKRVVGRTRTAKWVVADTSYNFFRSINESKSVVYDERPTQKHPEDASFADVMAGTGIWEQMQMIDRDKNAIQEMAIRVDIVDNELVYRAVFPEFLTVETMPGNPNKIQKLTEKRYMPDLKASVYEIFDLTSLSNPLHYFTDCDGKAIPALSDGTYPYLIDGEPIIPYNIRHAKITGRVWNPELATQLQIATLHLGMGYSFYLHSLFHASWATRYVAGYKPAGTEEQNAIEDETGVAQPTSETVQTVESDPQMVLILQADNATQQGVIGQWGAPVSPKEIMESIKLYERGMVELAGLDQADAIRTSGDPAAGISIIVSLDEKRRQQKRQIPVCRVADLDLIRMSAGLMNTYAGTSYPLDGWTIEYSALPESDAVKQETRNEIQFGMSIGVMSKMEALRRLYPNKTDDEREAMISEVALEKTNENVVSTNMIVP